MLSPIILESEAGLGIIHQATQNARYCIFGLRSSNSRSRYPHPPLGLKNRQREKSDPKVDCPESIAIAQGSDVEYPQSVVSEVHRGVVRGGKSKKIIGSSGRTRSLPRLPNLLKKRTLLKTCTERFRLFRRFRLLHIFLGQILGQKICERRRADRAFPIGRLKGMRIFAPSFRELPPSGPDILVFDLPR